MAAAHRVGLVGSLRRRCASPPIRRQPLHLGVPIASLQGVGIRLANIAITVESGRNLARKGGLVPRERA